VYAFKYFLEIDKIDVQTSLPFMTLFNDVSQGEDLFCAASLFSETRLLFSQHLIDRQREAFDNDLTEDFTW
jgi:hypothetical protein